jgi:hypothetical protein
MYCLLLADPFGQERFARPVGLGIAGYLPHSRGCRRKAVIVLFGSPSLARSVVTALAYPLVEELT